MTGIKTQEILREIEGMPWINRAFIGLDQDQNLALIIEEVGGKIKETTFQKEILESEFEEALLEYKNFLFIKER